ncbi:hypothetical protein CH63R_03197 [Colletotrichum higginsianum IMI 349063]|uniref:Uncharacterized protein n=1 Tax=Colletotrichum higginsianum (strain IMI 349063) TaxID=759273 RepID=A0A1B7YR10_COLHI|nr:hypothetical protein CH63R_03197 [Colletotrichum higginsianum IMI 349063]OBR14471.1 hypothetical protein CH63R_03197 [Colletotrichum higginsianum IMI 349063]
MYRAPGCVSTPRLAASPTSKAFFRLGRVPVKWLAHVQARIGSFPNQRAAACADASCGEAGVGRGRPPRPSRAPCGGHLSCSPPPHPITCHIRGSVACFLSLSESRVMVHGSCSLFPAAGGGAARKESAPYAMTAWSPTEHMDVTPNEGFYPGGLWLVSLVVFNRPPSRVLTSTADVCTPGGFQLQLSSSSVDQIR